MRRRAILGALVLSAMAASVAQSEDLYKSGNWPALASDRLADRVGDSLTVVVYETSSATNTAQSSTNKATTISGQYNKNASSGGLQLGLNGAFNGAGQTGRTDKMVAQISVVVDAVMPNGDLHVYGEQLLNINGEKTRIKIRGRVRRADISSSNTVISSRLADAEINYDGKGFVSKSAKLGFLNHIFAWLGLE